jgi:hypothetical protein
MATDGARQRAQAWLLECAKLMGPPPPATLPVVILPEVEESLAELLDAERGRGPDACPTCPVRPPLNETPSGTVRAWSSFGPCADGLFHDTTCPVARKAMAEAQWPCGKPKYPELSAMTTEAV